jgi:selT/selW/selH-like putative selenoprotein
MERSANDVELVESSGGAFEVYRDGRLLFSKKQLGRFPTDDEIDGFVTR